MSCVIHIYGMCKDCCLSMLGLSGYGYRAMPPTYLAITVYNRRYDSAGIMVGASPISV